MKIIVGFLCVAVLTFSACDTGVVETNFETLPAGSVRFVNYLAGNPKMDVVVDDKTLGAAGTTNMDFGAISEYSVVMGGTRNLGFDTTATDAKRKRVSANFIVTRAKATVFGAIDANKNPFLLGVIDTIPAALTSTNAAVRFIHAAGTRDSVTIVFTLGGSNDSTGMVGRAPRSVTNFRTITPSVYNVLLKKKNTSGFMLMQSLQFAPGKAYTLVAKGSTDPALPSLDLVLLPNN